MTVKPNVSLAPAKDAVKVTEVGVVTLPAVTENVVEREPCGTVAVEGMPTSAGDAFKLMVAPPLPGAEVRATVQVDPTAGLTAVGLQENPFKLGVCAIVTVPLFSNVDKGVPVALADVALANWTREEVPGVDGESVRLTVAITPFGIGVLFRPQRMHIADPAPYWQDSDLLAAPAPTANVTEEKSVVEYPRSH